MQHRILALVCVLAVAALAWLVASLGTGEVAEALPGVASVDGDAPSSAVLRGSDASRAGAQEDPRAGRASVATEAATVRTGLARVRCTGRVVDAAGAGVGGATVALHVTELGGGVDGGWRERSRRGLAAPGETPPVAETRTDAGGRYVLLVAFAGRALLGLAVRHEQFAPAYVREVANADRPAAELDDIVLTRGAVLAGTVVDPQGLPVPGAEVRVGRDLPGGDRRGRGGPGGFRRGPQTAELVAPVSTDANGAFELRHVPVDRAVLVAEASSYLPAASQALRFEQEQRVEGIEIRLLPGVPLSGVVLDLQGQPVAAARVAAAPIEPRRGRRGPTARGGRGGDEQTLARREVETDEQGRFAFDAVAPGVLTLTTEHPQYATDRRDELDAQRTPRVEVRLVPRPGLFGIVRDRASGEPLARYAIVARAVRARADDERRRGRARAADAQRETERSERQAFLQDRLGPSGRAPAPAAPPTDHPGGRFELPDLEPGDYVLDVAAAGHAPIAAGVYTVEAGVAHPPLTIHLDAGSLAAGVVVARESGEPLVGARVELLLPAVPASGAPAAAGLAQLRGLFAGRGGDRGGAGGGGEVRVARTETAGDGSFDFGAQKPGAYRLRVVSRRRPEQTEDVVVGGALWRVAIGRGARVAGRVLGLEPDARVEVVFTHEDGQRETARADRDSGEYEIRALRAGAYFVDVEDRASSRGRRGGGGRGGRGGFDVGNLRSRLGVVVAAQQGRTPDLQVPADADLRYDVAFHDPSRGIVRGTVEQNGAPARGAEVRLAPLAPAAPAETQARRGRGARAAEWMAGLLLRADVGRDGGFELDDVAPGAYTLEVRAAGGRGGGDRGGRGGRGGGGGDVVSYREPVTVVAGGVLERHLRLQTGSLQLDVVEAGSGAATSGVEVALVRADEAQGQPAEAWVGLPSYQQLRPRGGKVEARGVPVGSYLFHVTGRGVTPVSGSVDAVPGDAVPVRVEVEPAGGAGSIGAAAAAAFLQGLDADGDGVLSGQELEGRGARLLRLDADGDGRLTASELEAMAGRGGARRGR